jgi:hypothetical protein
MGVLSRARSREIIGFREWPAGCSVCSPVAMSYHAGTEAYAHYEIELEVTIEAEPAPAAHFTPAEEAFFSAGDALAEYIAAAVESFDDLDRVPARASGVRRAVVA